MYWLANEMNKAGTNTFVAYKLYGGPEVSDIKDDIPCGQKWGSPGKFPLMSDIKDDNKST